MAAIEKPKQFQTHIFRETEGLFLKRLKILGLLLGVKFCYKVYFYRHEIKIRFPHSVFKAPNSLPKFRFHFDLITNPIRPFVQNLIALYGKIRKCFPAFAKFKIQIIFFPVK